LAKKIETCKKLDIIVEKFKRKFQSESIKLGNFAMLLEMLFEVGKYLERLKLYETYYLPALNIKQKYGHGKRNM
jgi:hypothetical protein